MYSVFFILDVLLMEIGITNIITIWMTLWVLFNDPHPHDSFKVLLVKALISLTFSESTNY